VGTAAFPAGILELIAQNGVSLAFNLSLAAIFLLAVVARLKPVDPRLVRFARGAPTSLVAVGLLGALAEVLVGLQSVEPPALDGAAPPLIEALKAACFTGILGTALAVTFRIYQSVAPTRETAGSDGDRDAGTGAAGTRAESEVQDLHARLARELETPLVARLDKLGCSLTDQLEGMRRELGERFQRLEAAPRSPRSADAETQLEAPLATPVSEQPEEQDNLPARRFPEDRGPDQDELQLRRRRGPDDDSG
jgi:hypothetical protein